MAETTRDLPPPREGPPFARLSTWPYRAEMLALTLGLIAVLFYWRLLVVHDLDVVWTVFWILWPDLAAFIPIGLASAGGKGWPAWGSSLYNVVHTFLTWAAVFALWGLWTGTIAWPLLGWAGHIAADRASGYYLRAKPGS